MADLAMTLLISSVPPAHLNYLNIQDSAISPELKSLDFALIRAIGSCLIALGIGVLTIIYGPIRKGIKWTIIGLLSMVTIAEGGNGLQMYFINSPFFLFPFVCVILTWVGAFCWWYGNKNESN